jgi:hypothetical protein
MEIPLNAQIECTDGMCGHSVCVLINPLNDQVTHVVVEEASFPNTEYMVPVDIISETIADTIRLHCSKAEMEKMDLFLKTKVIEVKTPENSFWYSSGSYGLGSYYYLPYVTPGMIMQMPMEQPQIPPGEMAVRRGTLVHATDGDVGKVDEFVVNPENGHITHLVMREGHLWGKKDVIIPVSAMGESREDTVFLKLDKHQIESLPTFPLQRRWA